MRRVLGQHWGSWTCLALTALSLAGCSEVAGPKGDAAAQPPVSELIVIRPLARFEPVCDRSFAKPPPLKVVEATVARETLWTDHQLGNCIVFNGGESVDLTFTEDTVQHSLDCNRQTGEWNARGRTLTMTFVRTTLMMCAGGPGGDLGFVTSWGVDERGYLHLLDRRGRIVLVTKPARTQDPIKRCEQDFDTYEHANVRQQCTRAARRGALDRNGMPKGCVRSLDTDPPTIRIGDAPEVNPSPGAVPPPQLTTVADDCVYPDDLSGLTHGIERAVDELAPTRGTTTSAK